MNNDFLKPSTRFTGIFIPVEILEIEELTSTDIILLAWIDALYCKEKGGCFASNAYLAKRLKINTGSVSNILTKLRRLGLILDVSSDGRYRIIRACINKKSYEQQSQSYEQDMNPDFISTCTPPSCRNEPPFIYKGRGVPPSHYYILENKYKEEVYKNINAQTAPPITLESAPQLHNNHPTKQIKFSFESSQFENISQADLDAWKELYPDLDINRQLKEMTQWILSNPSKAKHKKLWRKFVVIWLQRSYEKITNRAVYAQNKTSSTAVERHTFADKDPRPYRARRTIVLEDEDLPSLSNGKMPLTPLE